MQRLLAAFWSIALLRAGPQILPHSRFLLGLTLVAHWSVGFALGLFSFTPGLAAYSALAGTLVMTALVHGLLSLRRLGRRTVQTLTALAGAEILLGIAALPFSMLVNQLGAPGALMLVSLLVLGWNVAMAGNIFRQALELQPPLGWSVGLGYIFLSLMIARAILPAGQ